jgi:3'(2'), 5'-bisphosphate nucleotidase
VTTQLAATLPRTDSPRARERDVAIAAVRDAGLLCRAVRATFRSGQATTKEDRSPVTVADLGAQALIRLTLADAFPADAVMGEEDSRQVRDPESSQLAAEVRQRVLSYRAGMSPDDVADALDACADPGGPGRRWWTLDPVDGTLGFLRDEQYAVALALVEDGEVVLGVLGCPNLAREGGVGSLFIAERDEGVWELPLDGEDPPSPIRVAQVEDIRDARYAESVAGGHSAHDTSARIASLLAITAPPMRMDSQAKYAVVARGDASIYLRIPHGDYRENVWDHAAGALIVEEAGGIVSDIDGKPLDFTLGRRLEANRGVLATTARFHAQVVEAVRALT